MAGFIIQSEVGDYDPRDHGPNYVAQFKMLPKQTSKQEEKIAEFHKKCHGQVPSEAEKNFLEKAASLETYGVDPHPVKDQKGNQMYLGVTHLGIVTFQGNKRTHLFKWGQITKIAFEGKMFIVHVVISEDDENSFLLKNRGTGLLGCTSGGLLSCKKSKDKKKHACGFKCATFPACKHLWKCAVEQQYFFTLATSGDARKVSSGGSFFSRGSKFRFSGRCQREVYSDSNNITRDEPHFVRSSSNPQFVRSFNSSRSASLPNRLKDRSASSDMADVTMDSNHVTIDTLLTTSTPLEDHIEQTIPEESVLELGDSPYRPMLSPSSEDLPAFPGTNETPSAAAASSPVDKRSATLPARVSGGPAIPPDLDAQIQELQKELDQCRKSSTSNGGVTGVQIHSVLGPKTSHGNEIQVDGKTYKEVPVDVQTTEQPRPVTQVSEPGNNHIEPRSGRPDENTTPNGGPDVIQQTPEAVESPSAAQRNHSVCRALTIAIFVVFTVMLIMAIFVLESDFDVPVLKEIRQMPEVQDFKQQHYTPLKSTVSQKMGGLFKG